MEWIIDNAALFWLILCIAFLIFEGATQALTTIWFAGGSIVSLLLSLITPNIYIQFLAFVISSSLLLYLTRPLLQKKLNDKFIKTNADRLIGKTAVVKEKVSYLNTGQVLIKGQVWTAITKSEDIYDIDEQVVVDSIEGVKLVVRKKEEEWKI